VKVRTGECLVQFESETISLAESIEQFEELYHFLEPNVIDVRWIYSMSAGAEYSIRSSNLHAASVV
jgi:hypothetical protein